MHRESKSQATCKNMLHRPLRQTLGLRRLPRHNFSKLLKVQEIALLLALEGVEC